MNIHIEQIPYNKKNKYKNVIKFSLDDLRWIDGENGYELLYYILVFGSRDYIDCFYRHSKNRPLDKVLYSENYDYSSIIECHFSVLCEFYNSGIDLYTKVYACSLSDKFYEFIIKQSEFMKLIDDDRKSQPDIDLLRKELIKINKFLR